MAPHSRSHAGETSLPDIVQRVLLVAPLIALPWLIGGIVPVAQRLLGLATGVGLVVWLARYRPGSSSNVFPAATWGLVAALAWGALQLVPLPADTLRSVAPRTFAFLYEPWEPADAATRETLRVFRHDLGDYADTPPAPTSLYPASTRHDLTFLAMATALFFLGAQLLSRSAHWRWILLVIAIHGMLFAFFGIAQQLIWSHDWIGKIYGRVELTGGGRPFGAFVNRNNGVGHLNLCLAAAIGLFVLHFNTRSGEDEYGSAYRPAGLIESWRYGFMHMLSGLTATRLAILLSPVVIAAGIVMALSRGGWVAAAFGLAVVSAVLWRSRRIAAMLLVAAALLGAGWLVLWLGQGTAIQQRWRLLQSQFESPTDARLGNWSVAQQTVPDFWTTGTGLGTYRHVYRAYLDAPQGAWYYHAENQYVEALVEGGLVGLALLIAMLGAVGLACYRLLLQPRDTADFAWGIAGTYALTTQAVHSLFDFGLYLPANMALFAFLCGGLCGRASRLAPASAVRWSAPRTWPNALRSAPIAAPWLGATLLAFLTWGLADLHAALSIRSVIRAATKEPQTIPDAPVTDRQLSTLATWLTRRPDDAEGQVVFAKLLIERYRLQELQRRLKNEKNKKPETVWLETSTLAVHAMVREYLRTNRLLTLRAFRESDSVQHELRQAAAALRRATAACPILPDSWLLLGELAPAATRRVVDVPLLAVAGRLARGRRGLLRECGLAQLQAGAVIAGLSDLWRAAANQSERRQVLDLAWRYDRLQESLEALPIVSLVEFSEIARSWADERPPPAVRRVVALLSEGIQRERAELPLADRLYLEAQIAFLRQQTSQAVDKLEQAVHNRPNAHKWRAELVRTLLELGRSKEAESHARFLAAAEPENRRYLTLLKEAIRQQLDPRSRHSSK